MDTSLNILTIIPARGGSKGIPNKNIIDVCGKPLIAYSIESALELKKQVLIKELIVSTDSADIAEIAKQNGASVPFLRPDIIAKDNSKTIDAIIHALDWFLENKQQSFDAVLLLQPTSPLRKIQELVDAIHLFFNNKADSLISVYKEEYINDLVMYKMADINSVIGKPLNPLHNKGVRRQDHGSVYVRNGSIYLTDVKLLRSGLIIADYPLLFEMTKSSSINVDTLEDLELLRKSIC